MIAKYEDRLVREPLPLPPRVDPSVVSEFDYRRVYATGLLRHDQEMLIGPRIREGQDGFMVITPLERGEGESTVLVNRGWISKNMMEQKEYKIQIVVLSLLDIAGIMISFLSANYIRN